MASNRAQILITAVDQTKSALASVKANLEGLSVAASKVHGALAGLGVALSAAGLGAMVKSALESADALNKLSQRVGITVESLSTLMPAAELSGVSAQTFETGLKKLATTMFEAATGSEESARRFAALGIEFKNQDGRLRATDQVLLDLADRFKAMPDGAEKSALAVALFGKSGAELIPFLNLGREGVAALTQEMTDLGVQIGGDTAAQAEVFNDSLTKLELATTSIANRVIEAFLPAMNEMAAGMVESAKQGGSLHAILDGVVRVLKTLALGAATVGKAFVALGEAIGAGVAAAVQALRGNVAGAKALIADLKGSLIKRLDELAAFRDSLFDPKPIEVKAPKIQADPELLLRLTKPKAAEPAQDTTGAQTALMKAQLDAEFALLKDGLERQQRALDVALEDRLVAVRDYYAQKTALELREIDAEIARKQQELARSQQTATTGKSENDRLRAKAEVAKAEADLITLNNRRADIEQANARKAAQAERELADALAQAREELASITGQATDADRRAAIERQFRDLRARLAAEGDTQGVSLIDRLIDVKAAQAELQALEQQWRLALETMRNAEQSANIQQQQGLMTTADAQARIAEAHRQAAAALDELLPKMEAAARALGPEAVARVQAWKNELASVKQVTDPIAESLNTSIKSAFEDMFVSIGQGAKTAQDAFLDFARSVIAAIQRITAQRLAEQLFGNMFGGAGDGGGIGAFFANLFKGFASGGLVTGPGTATSDSIPARLSAGEYVVRAAAVQRFGVAFLDAINGLKVPPVFDGTRLAFAAGGLVPAVQPAAAPSQAVRIVNVIDPSMAADYLNSPAGEKVVMNVLSRNAGAVKHILAGA